MINRRIFYIVCIILISCTSEVEKNRNIEIKKVSLPISSDQLSIYPVTNTTFNLKNEFAGYNYTRNAIDIFDIDDLKYKRSINIDDYGYGSINSVPYISSLENDIYVFSLMDNRIHTISEDNTYRYQRLDEAKGFDNKISILGNGFFIKRYDYVSKHANNFLFPVYRNLSSENNLYYNSPVFATYFFEDNSIKYSKVKHIQDLNKYNGLGYSSVCFADGKYFFSYRFTPNLYYVNGIENENYNVIPVENLKKSNEFSESDFNKSKSSYVLNEYQYFPIKSIFDGKYIIRCFGNRKEKNTSLFVFHTELEKYKVLELPNTIMPNFLETPRGLIAQSINNENENILNLFIITQKELEKLFY